MVACVAGGIVSAREIKFWTSERRSREENGERDSPHSPRGFTARLSKTLFRGRLKVILDQSVKTKLTVLKLRFFLFLHGCDFIWMGTT